MTTSAFATGEMVGAYVLGDVLGVGGMGVVYATLTDAVAIKLLHPECANDAYMVERFHAEARACAAVHHRNVVRVFDHGRTRDGLPFLVMERVAGEPLGKLVQRGRPLSLRRATEIVRQILHGLEATHRAGFVHGDIKTDNVLVAVRHDGSYAVTLIDFGLARPAGSNSVHDGLVSGTPEYMAPEVASGGPVTAAADIYATGVILYELLTGVPPFTGATSGEVLRRQLRDDVTPPSLLDEDSPIPPALERIVMRALAKRPRDRFPSARAFATALRVALPRIGIHTPARPHVARDAPTLVSYARRGM
jgi:eukaryotic-like serine/threonine-protein kinase